MFAHVLLLGGVVALCRSDFPLPFRAATKRFVFFRQKYENLLVEVSLYAKVFLLLYFRRHPF